MTLSERFTELSVCRTLQCMATKVWGPVPHCHSMMAPIAAHCERCAGSLCIYHVKLLYCMLYQALIIGCVSSDVGFHFKLAWLP